MSILEITGITMVGSYIAAVANPESIDLNKYFELLNFEFLNNLNSKNKVNFFGLTILALLFIRFFTSYF